MVSDSCTIRNAASATTGGSGRSSPLTARSTGRPPARESVDELGKAGEVGVTGGAGGGIRLVQQLQDRAELGQCVPPGPLDGPNRLAGAVGVSFEQRVGELALHHDQRHPVRHHVMQLAGDPQSLLLGPDPLRLQTAQLEVVELVGAAGDQQSGAPGCPRGPA